MMEGWNTGKTNFLSTIPFIPLLFFFNLCASVVKNKKPQLPGGESWGSGNSNRLPALPRGRISRRLTSRAGFLACGFLLPTPSRTYVQWLKNRYEVRGWRLEAKDEFFIFFIFGLCL
jgi:hypothetical protein